MYEAVPMLHPLSQFLYLARVPIETSVRKADQLSIAHITNVGAFLKSKEYIAELIKAAVTEVASVRALMDQGLSSVRVSSLDEKRAVYLVLAVRESLKNMIDWGYYETFLGERLNRPMATIRKSIDGLIADISDFSANDFYQAFDASAITLKYYKIFDSTQKHFHDNKFALTSNLFLLRNIFDAAYSASQKEKGSSEPVDIFNSIVRSIQFPPAYYKAGMAILSHFGTVLRQKYPDIEVKIRIEQQGLVVRMIVETPDGNREIVEQALDDYRQVITGKKAAEDFLDNPLDVMELKNLLEVARMEVRHQQALLSFAAQRSHDQQLLIAAQNSQIERLENRTDRFIGFFWRYAKRPT